MKSAAQRRSILPASIGTSPAVLTNAVWALAHQAVPVIIAGGCKTMSALLFSCMSLLGREQDKVYREVVLRNE